MNVFLIVAVVITLHQSTDGKLSQTIYYKNTQDERTGKMCQNGFVDYFEKRDVSTFGYCGKPHPKGFGEPKLWESCECKRGYILKYPYEIYNPPRVLKDKGCGRNKCVPKSWCRENYDNCVYTWKRQR